MANGDSSEMKSRWKTAYEVSCIASDGDEGLPPRPPRPQQVCILTCLIMLKFAL